MKPGRKVINIVKHTPTGAEVPIMVSKTSDKNVIEDFKEVINKRRGFTLSMLCDRWDKCAEDILEILKQFQVPGHLRHQDVMTLPDGTPPISVAIFFEEYIYGIEKNLTLPHKKVKPKELEDVKFH